MPFATAAERVGVVLAGGRDSVADWNWRPGTSLLDQSRRILQRAGFERIIVSGAAQHSGSLDDLHPGQGPLGGLATVLRRHPDLVGQTLVIVPTDMPALNPRALTRLAEIAELQGSGAVFDLGPLPVAVVNKPALAQIVLETLNETGSVQALVARMGLPVLASLPDDGLDNVGSLEELKEVRQRLDATRSVTT